MTDEKRDYAMKYLLEHRVRADGEQQFDLSWANWLDLLALHKELQESTASSDRALLNQVLAEMKKWTGEPR